MWMIESCPSECEPCLQPKRCWYSSIEGFRVKTRPQAEESMCGIRAVIYRCAYNTNSSFVNLVLEEL